MPFKHLMIDIEALGKRPGSAMIEIAAAEFDLESGTIGAHFHRHILPAAPFTSDLATLKWHQDRGTLIPHPEAVGARKVISDFLLWLAHRPTLKGDWILWSWGSTYDFPILDAYIDLLGTATPPWDYYQPGCARRIWQLAHGSRRHPDRPHEALADVRAAIRDLCDAYHTLRGTQPPAKHSTRPFFTNHTAPV